MHLDPRTLALYTTAISLLLGALAFVYGRSRRVYPGYNWWVSSLLLFALALGSIGFRGVVPEGLARFGPASVGLAAILVIGEGHWRFVGLPARPRLPLALAALTLLVVGIVANPAQPQWQRTAGAIGVGLAAIAVGVQFVRHPLPALRKALLACSALLFGFGLVRIARGAQFILAGPGFDVLESEAMSIISYTANAVFVTLWGYGLMFLCAARVEAELDESRAALNELARKDPLTGLLNRRAFFEDAGAELQRARRYQMPLALLMIDIDRFKSVNDQHGHPTGDSLLVATSRRLQLELRGSDLLGRMGGEEFAVLLVQTPAAEAMRIAERLRAAVAATAIDQQGVRVARSASIGVAIGPELPDTLDELVRSADAALYRAKHAGRDRVET